jgi:hypothetical protein
MCCRTGAGLRARAVAAGFGAVEVRPGPETGAAADRPVLIARRWG